MHIITDLMSGPSHSCLQATCGVVHQSGAATRTDYMESTRCKVRADNEIKRGQYVFRSSPNLRSGVYAIFSLCFVCFRWKFPPESPTVAQ